MKAAPADGSLVGAEQNQHAGLVGLQRKMADQKNDRQSLHYRSGQHPPPRECTLSTRGLVNRAGNQKNPEEQQDKVDGQHQPSIDCADFIFPGGNSGVLVLHGVSFPRRS